MKYKVIRYTIFITIILFVITLIYWIDSFNKNSKERIAENNIVTDVAIDKNLNIAIANFDTLNPILSNNQDVQNISRVLYEPLINLNNMYEVEQDLATEWAKISNNTYIVKLRENVLWSNGEKFNSQDVFYTINKLKEVESIYSSDIAEIADLTVVDEYTIKIDLLHNIPFFEYNLTFPILNRNMEKNSDLITLRNV